MTNEIIQYSVSDMERLATAIAKSKLFGMKTPEEALSLMAIAQAEGLHPAIAARDYHIIQGRPTLKADAMLARFQKAGGKVEWHTYTDDCCDATISHPQGGTVRVLWDMERVKKAEIKNIDMYRKYPRNMLRSRVVSEGIRTVYPGVVVGTYTPEEAEEFEKPKSAMAQWAETPVTIEQPRGLQAAREEFMRRLNLCNSAIQLSEFVASQNKLIFVMKEEEPEMYENLSQEINRTEEAFKLSEAAE